MSLLCEAVKVTWVLVIGSHYQWPHHLQPSQVSDLCEDNGCTWLLLNQLLHAALGMQRELFLVRVHPSLLPSPSSRRSGVHVMGSHTKSPSSPRWPPSCPVDSLPPKAFPAVLRHFCRCTSCHVIPSQTIHSWVFSLWWCGPPNLVLLSRHYNTADVLPSHFQLIFIAGCLAGC